MKEVVSFVYRNVNNMQQAPSFICFGSFLSYLANNGPLFYMNKKLQVKYNFCIGIDITVKMFNKR